MSTFNKQKMSGSNQSVLVKSLNTWFFLILTIIVILGGAGRGQAQPTTVPSAPIDLSPTVQSLYNSSGTYVNLSNINYYEYWGGWATAGPYAVPSTSSVVLGYTGVNYGGVNLNAGYDFHSCNYLHLDVFAPNGSSFGIKLVSYAGGEANVYTDAGAIVANTWVHLDIPLSKFTAANPALDLTQIHQIGLLDGGKDFYIDNFYFVSRPVPLNVAITSPVSGVTLASGNFTIIAPASIYPGTIAGVDFYDNGSLLGSVYSAPYNFSATGLANGPHALTAVAQDGSGNSVTSAVVNVTIATPVLALFPDGGFDSPAGTSGSWTVAQGGGNTYSYPVTGGNPGGYGVMANVGGAYGLWVGNSNAVISLTAFNLTAGQTYTFVEDMKLISGSTVGGLKIDFTPSGSTGDMFPSSILNGGDWATYSFSVTIPAGTTGFKVVPEWGANSTVGYDNIGVMVPPLPVSVSITSPTNNAAVNGGGFVVSATGSVVPGTVTNIAFYLDSTLLGNVTNAPFIFNVPSAANGAHTLVAVARDSGGIAATSAVVHVTAANLPPTVALTSPSDGSAVLTGASVPLTVMTAGAVTNVGYYIDGTLVGSSAGSPFSSAWTALAGGHAVTAAAHANNGLSTTSAVVHITVLPTPAIVTAAPTLPQGQVLSLWNSRGVYTNILVDDFYQQWWAGQWTGHGNYTIPGTTNVVLGYQGLQFVGVGMHSANDVSGYNTLHVDVYTPNGDSFAVRLISAVGGSADVTYTTAGGVITSNSWVHLDIPLSQFKANNPGMDLTQINQLGWIINNSGENPVRDFYIDNVYFYYTVTPLTVSISSPTNNQVVYSNLTIRANASVGHATVTGVDFYDGATWLGNAASEPFSYSAIGLAAGSHALTAVATDSHGNSATSPMVTVFVTNAPIPSFNAYEPFNYGTGSLVDGTANTGTGFTGNWTLPTSAGIVAGLTYPGLPTTGHAYQHHATGSQNSLAFGSPLNDGTKYVSFLMQGAGNPGATAAGVFLQGDNSSSLFVGFEGGYSASQTSFGLGTVSSTALSGATPLGSTIPISNTAVHLVVLKLEFNTSGANDTVSLWIDPPAGVSAPGVDANVVDSSFDVGSITKFGINIQGAYGAIIDEVRVGGSYGDVVGGNVTTPLNASIASPTNTAAILPDFTISATAVVNPGSVTNVSFYDGAVLLGNATSSPYSYSVSGASAGSHGLKVVAKDSNGNAVTSAVVNVTVGNFTKILVPDGDFESPAGGLGSWVEVQGGGNTFSYLATGGNPTGYGVIANVGGGWGIWVANNNSPIPLASLGLVAGQTYTFVEDMMLMSGNSIGGLKVDFSPSGSTGDMFPSRILNGGSWTTYSFTVTIPANCTGVVVVPEWGANSTVGFDNVGVLVPSANFGFGSGLVSLTSGQAQVVMSGIAGKQYSLQRATNVTFTAGISNFPAITAPVGGNVTNVDNFSDLGATPKSAFYRLHLIQ